MNSPSTNVAVMYSSENNDNRAAKSAQLRSPAKTQPSMASLIADPSVKFESHQSLATSLPYSQFDPAAMPPPPQNQNFNAILTPDPVLVSDADLLLNLHSPFASGSPTSHNLMQNHAYNRSASITSNQRNQSHHNSNEFSPSFGSFTPTDHTFGDMVIDTQDVDMSVLGADMMPWDLEYLPHDMLYFGDSAFAGSGFGDDGAHGEHSTG